MVPYEWGLGAHFGDLIDLEHEMGQWLPVFRLMTSVITSWLFVTIWSIRVADVFAILYSQLFDKLG